MSLQIVGWVELRAPGMDFWQPMIDLSSFCFCGSEESDFLFGFRRQPSGRARFAHRGIPADATEPVCLAWDQWRGLDPALQSETFGHTYATFQEAAAALREPDAPAPNEWSQLLQVVPRLVYQPIPLATEFRFVVWAYW